MLEIFRFIRKFQFLFLTLKYVTYNISKDAVINSKQVLSM